MWKLIYSLKKSSAHKDLDAEESDHPKVDKYQDAEATSDIEVPEDHEVPVSG